MFLSFSLHSIYVFAMVSSDLLMLPTYLHPNVALLPFFSFKLIIEHTKEILS